MKNGICEMPGGVRTTAYIRGKNSKKNKKPKESNGLRKIKQVTILNT